MTTAAAAVRARTMPSSCSISSTPRYAFDRAQGSVTERVVQFNFSPFQMERASSDINSGVPFETVKQRLLGGGRGNHRSHHGPPRSSGPSLLGPMPMYPPPTLLQQPQMQQQQYPDLGMLGLPMGQPQPQMAPEDMDAFISSATAAAAAAAASSYITQQQLQLQQHQQQQQLQVAPVTSPSGYGLSLFWPVSP